MSYDLFKKQLREKSFSPVYRFFGEEVYLKRFYLNSMRETLVAEGFEAFDLLILTRDSLSINDAMDFSLSPPVMGESKLLIFNDTGIFSVGGGKNEEKSAPKKDLWQDLFADVPPYLHMVFCEDKIDKRSAAAKAYLKIGVEVSFDLREKSELCTWIVNLSNKHGKDIKKEDAAYLIECAGRSMTELETEINKLVGFTGVRKSITRDDIDELIVRELQTKRYMWSDALVAGDASLALTALYELRVMGFEAHQILFDAISSFLSITKACFLADDGESYANIIARLKMPREFFAKKCIADAKKCGRERAVRALKLLRRADFNIKNGVFEPWIALEILCAEV